MIRQRVTEGAIATVSFDIGGGYGGSPLPMLTVGTLTLIDLDTFVPGASPAEGIINSRQAQDILTDPSVVIDGLTVTWTTGAADTVVVTERREIERHRALFHFEWEGGTYDYEVEIEVTNLREA